MPPRKYFLSADVIEPDLLIDNAHDMGCMSADFCNVTKLDRKLDEDFFFKKFSRFSTFLNQL
jgi:hypothetical protein